MANLKHFGYAQEKIRSVCATSNDRTDTARGEGTYPAKPPTPVFGGLLAFDSDWKPELGDSLLEALKQDQGKGKTDFGCGAGHGYFHTDESPAEYIVLTGGKPATEFLFKLISQLYFSDTVPMFDIQAYSEWLAD